jgi:pimeloyl-ACP methyl ester carboxylesterase
VAPRNDFVPWDSQPLDDWAPVHPPGYVVDLAGRRTHFVKKGKGPPVVLVHGFNLDHNTWMFNIDVLARYFTVYAVDLWGSGFSTREPLDYGFPLFAEQIRLLMDHLGVGGAHLVGHSMGGGTAIAFSVAHRDRVDRLVLVDSVGIPRPTTLRERVFRLPLLPELLQRLPTDFIRRKNLLDFWIHDPELLTSEVFRRLTGYQKIAGTTRATLSMLRRDFFNSLSEEIDRLGGLAIPTTIFWGRHDRAAPIEAGWEMHGRLPGSRFEVFDRSGHLPNFDEPDRFNDLVVGFLQG